MHLLVYPHYLSTEDSANATSMEVLYHRDPYAYMEAMGDNGNDGHSDGFWTEVSNIKALPTASLLSALACSYTADGSSKLGRTMCTI